jgi:hypothetical protein
MNKKEEKKRCSWHVFFIIICVSCAFIYFMFFNKSKSINMTPVEPTSNMMLFGNKGLGLTF